MTTTITRRATAALGALALGTSLAVVAAPSAQASTTAPTSTTSCSTGTLPEEITGRPADFKAGLPSGYWIWKDNGGWHLRVTHKPGTKAVYAGTIRTSDPMRVMRVRDEARDKVWRSADRKTTAFRLVNHGGIDGLDFTPRCSARVTFSLTVNGRAIDPKKIHLGAGDAHPEAATFTISRIPASA
ncbi:MAG: hypothetical protein AB7O74_07795 [Candidatus Nanopelagicales bacterium]